MHPSTLPQDDGPRRVPRNGWASAKHEQVTAATVPEPLPQPAPAPTEPVAPQEPPMAARKKTPPKRYAEAFKAKALADAARTNNSAAAAKHGVTAQTVANWKARAAKDTAQDTAAKASNGSSIGHRDTKPGSATALPPIELTGLQAYVRAVVQQEISAAFKRGFGA